MFLKLSVLLLSLGSCSKDAAYIPPQDGPVPIRTKDLTLPTFSMECINSYSILLDKLGGSHVVKSVILENGATMEQGGELISMHYYAQPGKEDNSLFRSLFVANYLDGGHIVSTSQNVWSLGCMMTDRAAPPFTNILYRSKVFLINTCFIWTVPKLAHNGYRIVWLIL